jgi:DMSO/TMAO reductase YedYZ molybdopterin-dependent catalytic subunit
MRVLPDVVGGTRRGRARRLLVAGTVIAAAAALTGCSRFDAALGQRQAVVTFSDNATLAQRLAVRTACAKTPNVTPQPLPSDMNSPYALEQVVYQINQASDADIAVLEKCLAKFPTVVGVTLQDSADEGN